MARIAKVTQAELDRALRAVVKQGLTVVRVLTHTDGYIIETTAQGEAVLANPATRVRPRL
jgi:hypothetical protein